MKKQKLGKCPYPTQVFTLIKGSLRGQYFAIY